MIEIKKLQKDIDLKFIGLSNRSFNRLKFAGINTANETIEIINSGKINEIRGVGNKVKYEIIETMKMIKESRIANESCGWCEDVGHFFKAVRKDESETRLSINKKAGTLDFTDDNGTIGICINYCPVCGKRLEGAE